MNAETGNEPESPKKRGRIPQSAWPQILERYRSGATLSAIAREFECTPSAISYILRKAEAAGGEAEAATPPAESVASGTPAEVAEVPASAPARAKPARRSSRAGTPDATAEPTEQPTPTVAEAESAPALAPAPAATPAPIPAPVAAPASIHSGETLRLNRPEPQPPVETAAPASQPAPAPAAAPVEASRATAQRAEPTPPVDAVEGRLRETARGCLSAYRSWRQQPGEGSIQALSDAVHELRKALARIEIDMSASRREEQAIRPIPIPAHRTSRRTP